MKVVVEPRWIAKDGGDLRGRETGHRSGEYISSANCIGVTETEHDRTGGVGSSYVNVMSAQGGRVDVAERKAKCRRTCRSSSCPIVEYQRSRGATIEVSLIRRTARSNLFRAVSVDTVSDLRSLSRTHNEKSGSKPAHQTSEHSQIVHGRRLRSRFLEVKTENVSTPMQFSRPITRAVNEIMCSFVDLEYPAKFAQAVRQSRWIIEDFVDLKLASIVESATKNGGIRSGEPMIDRGGGLLVPGIDEEHATAGSQA